MEEEEDKAGEADDEEAEREEEEMEEKKDEEGEEELSHNKVTIEREKRSAIESREDGCRIQFFSRSLRTNIFAHDRRVHIQSE